jgi:transposase-like protein
MPSRRAHYTDEFRAEVVAAMVTEGLSTRLAAERYHLSKNTTREWYATWGPKLIESGKKRGPKQQHTRRTTRSAEELTALVYDAVAAVLRSITNRATTTGQPEWIERQTADALAKLDESQWNQVARFIASFRPLSSTPALADGAADPEGAGEEGGQTIPTSTNGRVGVGANGYAVDAFDDARAVDATT